MSSAALFALIVLFFVTSLVGVVTGSNSLITVPVMFQFGIDPKVAVATNMFGLLFGSIGATIPFFRSGALDPRRLTPLVALTLVGSTIGALLVGLIRTEAVPIIVSVSMIVVVVFTIRNRNAGVGPQETVTRRARVLVYAITFALGIYGGLYSGGYVTLLTASYVAFFGMTFSEAVAGTKLINVFSSLVATAVFAWNGLVDYKLGAILAVTMFAAAFIGARTVVKLNDLWLRRIFLAVVLALAVKTIYDYLP